MSVRTRAILLGVGFVLLVLLWFLFLFRPNQNRISELRTQQEEVQQEIQNLQLELQRLLELQRQEPQLRAQFARLQDALPNEPRLPDFILQVHEAANLSGIDFMSISPSLPAPVDGAGGPGSLQAISVSVATTGTYFEIEDFVIRLERLQRAVRINSFALSPGESSAGPGSSPVLSVTFQMQMFMTSPAPVAGQPPVAPPPPAQGAAATPPPTEPTPTPAAGG